MRRLRYFVATADHLHFGRAAEQIGVAQPALSQQIQILEAELGVTLLERSRRHVKLTALGAVFLAEVRPILAQAERARLVVERARRGELGRIEIGYVGSVAYSGVLARSVTALQALAPDVEVNIHQLEFDAQMQQLRDGRIDVAFVRLPVGRDGGFEILEICREPILVALPMAHRLVAAETIDPRDLAGENFLATNLREGVGFFDTQMQVCLEAGFAPRIVSRSRDFAAMMGMVAADRGVALVPGPVSRLALPGVAYRAVRTDRASHVAALHRPRESSPALVRYLSVCRTAA